MTIKVGTKISIGTLYGNFCPEIEQILEEY